MRCLLFAFAAFVPFAFWQTEADPERIPTAALPSNLSRVLIDFEKANAAKDGPAVASLTLDGVDLLAKRPPVRGRDAVEKFCTGRGQSKTSRPFTYAVSGDVAFMIGGYSPAPPDEVRLHFAEGFRKMARAMKQFQQAIAAEAVTQAG